MNENAREAKALNEQEKETTMAGVEEMSEQQLEEVAGGLKKPIISISDHSCRANLGPRYKEKSVFGWNWYANCKICNKQFCLEWGPWSGDPD